MYCDDGGGCCDDERLPRDEDGDAALALKVADEVFRSGTGEDSCDKLHEAIFLERGGGGYARAAAGSDEGGGWSRRGRPTSCGITGLLASHGFFFFN